MIVPPTDSYKYPALPMEPGKIKALTKYLMEQGEHYGLGSKFPLPSFIDPDKKVDCSGFIRWCIWHGTPDHQIIPDGSVQQHEWADTVGFKKSDNSNGYLQDGAIRIGFLSPKDGGGIGHVFFVIDGETWESHGGVGPDHRAWGSAGWMTKATLYVLTQPS